MNVNLVKIAWKEFSGSLARFRVFLACLGVGAFAIAGAGSVTESFRQGLNAQAIMLLGGDVAFTAARRVATDIERDWLADVGDVSETASLRLMASSGQERKQADVRAVDNAFPHLGNVVLVGTSSLKDALKIENERWGIAVSQSFLDGLNVEIGDDVELGGVKARITARLVSEPDRLGDPGSFQPSALIALEAVKQAGRLEKGQLSRSQYLIKTIKPVDFLELETGLKGALGEDAIELRKPEDAVDGLGELLDLLESFLSVVGIASLIAGGIGITQATGAFLESRIGSIASLKAFGARASDIRIIYGLQLLWLSALGAMIGVALGASTPFAVDLLAGDLIPLPQLAEIYPEPLVFAFVLTLLTAAGFALPALGRARLTPPVVLFRSMDAFSPSFVKSSETAFACMAGVALLVGAILMNERSTMTALLLFGACLSYAVFLLLAYLIKIGAARMRKDAQGARRLMWSNLAGPGSLAPLIAPSLGLGVAILTLVVSVQSNLLRQIGETAPENAPSLVFSQIANEDAEALDEILKTYGIDTDDVDVYQRVPILQARITSLNGAPIIEENIADSERWVIGREIGVTYLQEPPKDVEMLSGKWWDADYSGPLLVSVEAGVARGLGITVGDTIGFRISGRDLIANVASIRKVDWGGFSVNRPFVFSPGVLSNANPQHFAIARVRQEMEAELIRALGRSHPDVIIFQVREALANVRKVMGDISIAINAIAAVVCVAGMLVLVGALITIENKRRIESAILKSYGATRSNLLWLYASEVGVAGASAVLIGVLIGVAASYPIVVNVFEAKWSAPWLPISIIVLSATIVCIMGGLVVGLKLLSEKPSRTLRAS